MPSGVYIRTAYHRKRLSESLKGHSSPHLAEYNRSHIRKGVDNPFYGRKHTPETKEKLRLARLGKPGHPHTEAHKQYISKKLKGIKRSEEMKRKISILHKGRIIPLKRRLEMSKRLKGENNPNWKGGITPLNRRARSSIEYTLWRTAVFMRDDYTCQMCFRKDEVSGELNADHVKPFAYFPELRFAIDNGRTLCITCHKTTDSYMRRGSRKQYEGERDD